MFYNVSNSSLTSTLLYRRFRFQDLNNDSRADLIATLYNKQQSSPVWASSSLYQYVYASSGNMSEPLTANSALKLDFQSSLGVYNRYPGVLGVGDIDKDGALDLIVADDLSAVSGNGSRIAFVFGEGITLSSSEASVSGTLSSSVYLGGYSPDSVFLEDFNSDGR